MPRRIRTARRTESLLRADAACDVLVAQLGRALRDARRHAGVRQADVGAASALAQTTISRMERGTASSVSLRSWVRAAGCVGTDLKAYLAGATSTDRPRDAVHLRTQELVASVALGGGWKSIPEVAIDDAARGSRWLDLWLERQLGTRPVEVIANEIQDWFDDVGARFRDWDRRVERVRQLALATRTIEGPEGLLLPRVSGLWVIRSTRRNRDVVREHANLFRARFPASSDVWLAALRGSAPMPDEHGILWASVDGTRLFARHRPRGGREA
jgi:transcriptional regulator with XRE-family HTH domain